MTIEIPLTKAYTALVDDVDKDLAELKWQANVGGNTAYATRAIGKSSKNPIRVHLSMHRVIFARILGRELISDEHIDHINGIGTDNRRSNLRLATHRQNIANSRQRKNKKALYKGVTLYPENKTNPYVAVAIVNGKPKHLGTFPTAEEAHRAYCIVALTNYGEFANFGENSPYKGYTLVDFERESTNLNEQVARISALAPDYIPHIDFVDGEIFLRVCVARILFQICYTTQAA